MSFGSSKNLTGKRVLVVEDDVWIADDIGSMLESLGLEVIGPFPSVSGAEEAILRGPAPVVAVLDVKLVDANSFSVADMLAERGVPYVFHTGYARGFIPERYSDVPLFEKPVSAARVASTAVGLIPS